MYHYFKKGMTAGELISTLQVIIAELSLKSEDEILFACVDIAGEQSCRNDMLDDQENNHDYNHAPLEEVISNIPPHEVIRYFLDSEYDARDCDEYWERMQDTKREIFSEIIENLPKELKDEYEL